MQKQNKSPPTDSTAQRLGLNNSQSNLYPNINNSNDGIQLNPTNTNNTNNSNNNNRNANQNNNRAINNNPSTTSIQSNPSIPPPSSSSRNLEYPNLRQQNQPYFPHNDPHHYQSNNIVINTGVVLANRIKNMALTIIIQNIIYIVFQLIGSNPTFNIFLAINFIELTIFAVAWKMLVKDDSATVQAYQKYRKMIVWDVIIISAIVFIVCIILGNTDVRGRDHQQAEFLLQLMIIYLVVMTLIYIAPKLILICVFEEQPVIQAPVWIPLEPMRYVPPPQYMQSQNLQDGRNQGMVNPYYTTQQSTLSQRQPQTQN